MVERNPAHSPDIETARHPLVEELIDDSIQRLPPAPHRIPGAETRIINGLNRRLKPYLFESEDIQRQKESPEYTAYIKEHKDFADGVEEGLVACPDGRNDENHIIGPAEEVKPYRTLGGIPDTRLSTSFPRIPVLNVPELDALIKIAFLKKSGNFKKELVEYLQIHGISTSPEHGCGYLADMVKESGHQSLEIGMTMGGIPEYMAALRPDKSGESHINAFNNNAERAGGRGTTFLTFADHYSQGLIILPNDIHERLDIAKSLRENFVDLHDSGKIAMSEKLDGVYRDRILSLARSMGHEGQINTRDYTKLISNLILIGRIAREITLEHNGSFPFIPEYILEQANATETAKKLLAYRMIRNVTERILSGRKNGLHPLMSHPEQFIRIGSTGAENNSINVPFVQRTSRETITQRDIEAVIMLRSILTATLEKRGVDPKNEGNVILVTGEIEQEDYRSRTIFEDYLIQKTCAIASNAAELRIALGKSADSGEAIVVGGIFDGRTKTMKHPVTTRPIPTGPSRQG